MNEFIEKIRKYSDYSGEDGAEDAAVEAAEKALGLTFAEDYREYLLECGSAFKQIFAVIFCKYLLECGAACADGHIFTGINTVAETTALWRSRHPGITDGMYAVEIFEQDGIAAWQNGSGEVFLTRDGVSPRKLCDSMLEYVILMER